MTGPASEVDEVVAANAALYTAFETGDADAMGEVWDDADDVVCVHPGWPMLRGRPRVLRSWSVIMANTAYIQFFLTDVVADVRDDLALVTCEENILTSVGDESLGENARVVTTNMFRRRDGRWRLWLHHASPVLAPPDEVPEERP